MLPGSGMIAGIHFNLQDNCFTGTLPRLPVLKNVLQFSIAHNSFAGALPYGGMREMLAVHLFWININRFTGALPDGVQAMMAIIFLQAYANRFTGSLPGSGIRAWVAMSEIQVQ
eukprot:3528843-Amphidinium_carterae.1